MALRPRYATRSQSQYSPMHKEKAHHVQPTHTFASHIQIHHQSSIDGRQPTAFTHNQINQQNRVRQAKPKKARDPRSEKTECAISQGTSYGRKRERNVPREPNTISQQTRYPATTNTRTSLGLPPSSSPTSFPSHLQHLIPAPDLPPPLRLLSGLTQMMVVVMVQQDEHSASKTKHRYDKQECKKPK